MRKKGYITITENVDVDVDIDIDTIINNLDEFNENDLSELFEALEYKIGSNYYKRNSDSIYKLIPDNLYDEQKMELLKEIYEKLSINDLQKLKKQIDG